MQLQDTDLRVKHVPMGGRDLGDARLARQHPAHVGQAKAQLAQRGHQFHLGRARRFVQPSAAFGPGRWR